VTAAAKSGFDLDRERARLDSAVRRFPFHVRALRQGLFRLHVALNVTHVTPLIARISSSEDIDLLDHVKRIQAPPKWPRFALSYDARVTSIGIERAFDFTSKQMVHRHRNAGVLVAGVGDAHDLIGLRVLGDGIEVTAAVGSLRVETFHGYGRIHLPGAIPATIACAAVGRPVDSVFSHRWLSDTNWPVVSVEEVGATRTLITFDTGRVEWRRPFAGPDGTPYLLENV